MTLQDYYEELDKHDWYYQYSDDSRVYNKGQQNADRLKRISEESPKHKILWEGFCNHMFSGGPWGTKKRRKPNPIQD
jgi:hypothetical protein